MNKNKKEEPKIDESLLTPEDRQELHPKFPLGWVIFFSIIVLLMVACIIVIVCLKK